MVFRRKIADDCVARGLSRENIWRAGENSLYIYKEKDIIIHGVVDRKIAIIP